MALSQVTLFLFVAASPNFSLAEMSDFVVSSQGYQTLFQEAHSEAIG